MKRCIGGLLRDLRGIASACAGRRSYTLLFDQLYPDYFPVFLRTVEALHDTEDVMTALLKFMAGCLCLFHIEFLEFVFNKSGRISFDSSSVNGILLFSKNFIVH